MYALGVHKALALFGDTKQAMDEEKRGPVETGLMGLVATALQNKSGILPPQPAQRLQRSLYLYFTPPNISNKPFQSHCGLPPTKGNAQPLS